MPVKKKRKSSVKAAVKQSANSCDQEYVPLKILGATAASGELLFLMQFEGKDDANLIPASVANIKYPQLVIKFYEDRRSWHSTDQNAAQQ